MIIKSVRVQNFRSILDETLPCEQLTALVGPNGSGKSSFLSALEMFYSTNPKCSAEDFYAEDINKPIGITISFADLDEEEIERFSSYLENGELTVVRVLSLSEGKLTIKYHGSSLQNPDFTAVREATKAADKKAAYEGIRKNSPYNDLPQWKKQEEALGALKAWEAAHPDKCKRQRDDGQFFGFTEVAQGYLGKYTHYIPIHAVRDAADDAIEGKGSPITEIMDLVVRSVLVNRKEFVNLKEYAQKKYDDIMDPCKLEELSLLEKQLTTTLKTYVPDASVSLSWLKSAGIEIPLPKADLKLVEDGYASTVIRTGHGLQRTFILTMLQHLAIARRPAEKSAEETNPEMPEKEVAPTSRMPNLILGIEEPELYQHPSRQRHLAKILLDLTSGSVPGVAQKMQVIYGTHSPLFVGLDRFEQVRLLRKIVDSDGKPKITKAVYATLNSVAETLWEATDKKSPQFTGETLRPRLHAIMTPWMNEGFFADVAVLVEGEDDRAALLGTAFSMGYDFESKGISVIPCMGKNNLDRPYIIFKKLGIRTYVVWDSDEGNKDTKPEANRYLLRLMRQNEEDYPERVGDDFSCFKKDLETTLENEIGKDIFEGILNSVQSILGLTNKDQALKNPVAIRSIIEKAKEHGKSSKTIEDIVRKIIALKEKIKEL